MSQTSREFDAAHYLDSDEAIAAYLDAAIDECGDDPGFIAQALGTIARARNMSQLSRDTGLSRETLYRALSEEGNPTFSTVLRVCKALGVRISFRPAT